MSLTSPALLELAARHQLYLDVRYPPRACPRCSTAVHAKRSRAGDKVYWGCFRHGQPTWCGLPLVLPPHRVRVLDEQRLEMTKAQQEADQAALAAGAQSAVDEASRQRKQEESEALLIDLLSTLALSGLPSSQAPPQPPPCGRAHVDDVCKVCYGHEVDCVLLPCTHMALCVGCAARLQTCPLCRSPITARIKPIPG